MSRPNVTVYDIEKSKNEQNKTVLKMAASGTVALPAIFSAPIRNDIVSFVHHQIRNNKRQAHGVARNAGVQCSALSWGTGRAVSRLPRVKGGGTHRSGQAAYGNMVRGGHVFNPLVTWRKLHKRVNIKLKRHAIAAGVAASALPSLVAARGHKVDNVEQFPLVIDDSGDKAAEVSKTKVAEAVLKALGAYEDVLRVKDGKKLRAGQGKMRNRRVKSKKGPVLVHAFDEDDAVQGRFVKAFRNIPGLDLMHVERMNLLKLCPGGHLGRFVIWTKSAFEKLDALYGNYEANSAAKSNYTLSRSIMANSDVTGIINCDEVKAVLRPARLAKKKAGKKVNPLKNKGVMARLNPYVKAKKKVVS